MKHQYVSRWIGGLLKQGKRPKFRILYEVPDGESWQEHERRIIARCLETNRPIVNSTAGGEGLVMFTPEQRERHRQGIIASFTPENRKRRGDAAKARWANPEFRAKTIAAQKAAAARPENRSRLAKGVRRSPEGEARRVAAVKAYYENPENRERAAKHANRLRGPDGKMHRL